MIINGKLELLSAKFENIKRLKKLKHLTHASLYLLLLNLNLIDNYDNDYQWKIIVAFSKVREY